MTFRKRRNGASPPFDDVAGNGLLNRRALLGRGIMLAGAAGAGVGTSLTGAAAEPLKDDPWSLQTGETIPPLQVASRFEKHVVRTRSNPNGELRNSHARTPHHLLQGTVTPNSLFFNICHSGLPDIDPAQHKLVVHGLVKQPVVYTVESLERYPMVTRMHFVECA
jgi:sulfane dehydrogenase subunit SoxC